MTSINTYLTVGLPVLLSSSYVSRESTIRHKVIIRGWQDGRWIWLEVPPGEEKLPMPLSDRMCVVRFIFEGKACGFTANVVRVMDVDGSRFGGMHITWPEKIETVEVRKSPRVAMARPCVVHLTNGVAEDAELRDLSDGGCAVAWQTRAPPPAGITVQLSFTLPGGIAVDRVPTAVQSVRASGGVFILGCQFGVMDEILRNSIRLTVIDAIESMRASRTDRAIILDPHSENVRELVTALRDRQYEVVVVSHVMNAAYWLVAARTRAFFLSSEQTEMSVEDICRIIRGTPSMEKLAVIVYGGNDRVAGEKFKRAGASNYFSSITSVMDVIDTIAGAVPPVE